MQLLIRARIDEGGTAAFSYHERADPGPEDRSLPSSSLTITQETEVYRTEYEKYESEWKELSAQIQYLFGNHCDSMREKLPDYRQRSQRKTG